MAGNVEAANAVLTQKIAHQYRAHIKRAETWGRKRDTMRYIQCIPKDRDEGAVLNEITS